jgi:heparosan-N-sulfate-glucuronate 5-epimerase
LRHWTVHDVVLGTDRLPRIRYSDAGYQANPTVIASYGLMAYSRWIKERRPADQAIVTRAANWLVRRQESDGSWLYRFDFSFPGGHMAKPWRSALAQGEAMSLLERAYRLTGHRPYLSAAVRAIRPLQTKPGHSALVRCYQGCRHPFFEEYPSSPRSDVLNGLMFTLIGLYDLASIAPRSHALRLYQAGRRTLELALPRYDRHGVARYSLVSPMVASQEYQAIHVYLLRALATLRPDPRFSFYATRWLGDLGRAPA